MRQDSSHSVFLYHTNRLSTLTNRRLGTVFWCAQAHGCINGACVCAGPGRPRWLPPGGPDPVRVSPPQQGDEVRERAGARPTGSPEPALHRQRARCRLEAGRGSIQSAQHVRSSSSRRYFYDVFLFMLTCVCVYSSSRRTRERERAQHRDHTPRPVGARRLLSSRRAQGTPP